MGTRSCLGMIVFLKDIIGVYCTALDLKESQRVYSFVFIGTQQLNFLGN